MGYMRHHAIIVTSWSERIIEAHQKALEIFGDWEVTPIQRTRVNVYDTFFIGPDGSKEGWEDSDAGDRRRDEFVAWLDTQRYDDHSTWLKWAVVQYGDDAGVALIDAHSDEPVSASIESR